MPENDSNNSGMEGGDVGRHYIGARKHEARRRQRRDEPALSELWPRPNFRSMAESGEVTSSVALLYMSVYDNLRRSPVARPETDELTTGFWTRMYISGVGFMRRAWETKQFHTLDRLSKAFRASQESLGANASERQFATAATAKGRLSPNASPTDFPKAIVMRMNSLIAMGWPEDQGIPDDAKVGVIQVTDEKPVSGFSAGFYPALALPGTGRVVPLRHDPSATKAAAIREATEELKKQLESSASKGGTPVLQYERKGADWRGGQSVSESMMLTIFNFKGLQFGSTVSPAERQAFLNGLYDSAMDLCHLISGPPRAASCAGRLGIGFGSQGRGASTGAAHFDREQWFMHLTKTRGGGAFCHEYGHALDSLLLDAMFDPAKLPPETYYLSDLMASYYDEKGRYTMSSAVVGMLLPGRHASAIKAMDSLFESLFQRKRKDSFFSRSDDRDKDGAGSYWATPRELFARAFETYVLDRMLEEGIHNDFLVRHVDGYIRDRESHTDSIYPQGFQRRDLCVLFTGTLRQLKYLDL